ncbi:polysaccharide biosynthesis/export family protein [Silvibacterium sp.]|uniref:polysaccharide biosynthesis/export family protein n=1 Tax=Silvibacterium sp. TaxID=1964179 RepID=UPI0039E56B2C
MAVLLVSATGAGIAQNMPATATSTLLAPTSLPKQADGEESLRIGPGDLLAITVLREPEMDRRVRVRDSGEIDIPLAGQVRVSGLTPDEAGNAIAHRLEAGGYLRHPEVSVLVQEFATQQVAVLGQVARPGTYLLPSPRTLLDVLAMSGGLTDAADRHLMIEHSDGRTPAQVFLSNQAADALEANVQIRAGDRIVVPKAGIVYVLGDVGRPGGYLMQNESRITMLQAIAMAGGANHTASEEHVRLVRNHDGDIDEEEIPLKEMERGEVPDLLLQANDVVYVPFHLGKHILMGATAIVASASSAAIYASH